MSPAQFQERIQEEACKQAETDAQFQDKEAFAERAGSIGFFQILKQELRCPHRHCAVVIDRIGDGNGVADEGPVAARLPVVLSKLPFEAATQGTKVLNDHTPFVQAFQPLRGAPGPVQLVAHDSLVLHGLVSFRFASTNNFFGARRHEQIRVLWGVGQLQVSNLELISQ